jgi:hypothetical protein
MVEGKATQEQWLESRREQAAEGATAERDDTSGNHPSRGRAPARASRCVCSIRLTMPDAIVKAPHLTPGALLQRLHASGEMATLAGFPPYIQLRNHHESPVLAQISQNPPS